MRKGLLSGVAVFLASAGIVLATSRTMAGDWIPTSGERGQTPDRTGHPAPLPDKGEPAPMPTPKPGENGATTTAKPVVNAADCCDDGAGYGASHWVNIDYLLWWTKRRSLPPLVTTGDPASQGILGQPGTQLLFGGTIVPEEFGRSGIRILAGTWLGCEQSCGVEIGAFYFPQRDDSRVLGSDLSTFLARPFFSLNDSTESSEITSQPGLARGFTTVRTPLEFWGAEINGIHQLCCGCACRVDFLTGFRYLDLDEAVEIDEWIRVEDTLPPEFAEFLPFAGATITVHDGFATRNQFYGGQVGLDGAYARGPWQLGVRGKLGLGVTRQTVDISGGQTILFPNGVLETFNGGLLALATNIGRYHNNEFSVVPEVNVNVGYRFNECVLVYVGYSFLYWSRVVRAGDQIDRVIDVTEIPNFAPPGAQPTGIARPCVPFAQTDFWAQGLNFGVEFCW